MGRVIFRNATVLDTLAGELIPDRDVLVENGWIKDLGARLASSDAASFDLGGRVLMPGLSDAHVHVTAISADLPSIPRMSPSYVTARSAQVMREMLMRGFTTVRDAGGADNGLATAVEEGHLLGPRLLISGHALSQTGGHGDMRRAGAWVDDSVNSLGLGRVCDGTSEVRRAARDEIRNGASQIKIMASGGVSSPADRANSTQFAIEEIGAAVEEAEAAGLYVMAHAVTARSVKNALQSGVRSIEHGHDMDDECLDLLVAKDAFFVPTIATRLTLLREGLAAGFPALSHAKLARATGGSIEGSLRVFEKAHRRGVKIAYGTDLLGILHKYQNLEMEIRADVQRPIDIIRSATIVTADLFGMTGEIGVIASGARADLLVVDGNPLEDLRLLQEQGRHLLLIMRDGVIYKNALS